jgi:thymidylate synthase
MKNSIDKQYQSLLQDILDNGVEKTDRTGTGTLSVFGRQIRHNMSEGFPLLTTKKMAWKTMVTELLWFLNGDTNIKYLVDNGCHIWDGDAYKNYCKTKVIKVSDNETHHISTAGHYGFVSKEEFINKIKTDNEFAKRFANLGPVYGKQWRSWAGKRLYTPHTKADESFIEIKIIDQIANLISELKTNPDSRRLMVNAWNVAELEEMVLPPCHYGFQVYTRELSKKERYTIWFHNNYEMGMEFNEFEYVDFDDPYWKNTPKRAISLMWNQRSVDTFLGLPFNIASYGLLLMLLSKEVNMVPDQLIGNLGDTHLYLNHIEQSKEQIKRSSYDLPNVNLNFDFEYMDGYKILWDKINPNQIELVNYQSHPSIKAPLSN